jgi:hypothetical protein
VAVVAPNDYARASIRAPNGDSVSHVVSSSAARGRLKKYP